MSKTAHCKCCGAEFERVSTKGRPPAFCSEDCKLAHRYPVQPKPPCGKCHECGGPVEPTLGKMGGWRQTKKYCSETCKSKAKEQRYAILRHCEMCGSEFYRSKHEVRKYGGKFCSLTCNAKNATAHKIEKWERIREGIEPQPQGFVEHWEKVREQSEAAAVVAAMVNAEIVALRRIARKQGKQSWRVPIEAAKIKRKHSGCEVCGGSVSYEFGKPRKYCSDDCRLSAAATRRQTDEYRYAKRQSRRDSRRRNGRAETHRSRARKFGCEYAPFKVASVFERDKWRCQACGVDAPKRLRGTIEPNAPELDHITPLSMGGAHTTENAQCLCRSCNGLKGAKSNDEFIASRAWESRELSLTF